MDRVARHPLSPATEEVLARRRGGPRPEGLAALRAAFTATYREPGPAEVEVAETSANGVPVRIYRAPGACDLRPAVICLHGGGFVLGGLDAYEPQARRWALATGAAVVSVDYRLAPEHPYPAAPDDVAAVDAWLRAGQPGIDPTRIAVGGDSAGANLALELALRRQGPLAAMVLLCPAVDPEASVDETLEPRFRSGSDWWWAAYLPTDEDAYPLPRADLTDLPPTLIVTAAHDDLCDQGVELAERLSKAGNEVHHRHHADQFHVFHMYPAALPQAADQQREIAEFLTSRL
jgi:acetyl esterase